MAVRIRLKKLGRKHRPFYRICAMDVRVPRDGRALEELGTYDPTVPYTDARAVLNVERVQYWRLFFWTLFRRPRLFPLAITLAIMGFHFRQVVELHVG